MGRSPSPSPRSRKPKAKSRAKAAPPAKELKPWDARPWPKRGDRKVQKLYEAVGRALSHWEGLDSMLGLIFVELVVPGGAFPREAERAWGAIRTFEGRIAMLSAVGDTYFGAPRTSDKRKGLRAKFNRLTGEGIKWAGRRNEITHGRAQPYRPQAYYTDFLKVYTDPKFRRRVTTVCLMPSHASEKQREPSRLPLYAYTSIEISYYAQHFDALRDEAEGFFHELLEQASPETPAPQLRA